MLFVEHDRNVLTILTQWFLSQNVLLKESGMDAIHLDVKLLASLNKMVKELKEEKENVTKARVI